MAWNRWNGIFPPGCRPLAVGFSSRGRHCGNGQRHSPRHRRHQLSDDSHDVSFTARPDIPGQAAGGILVTSPPGVGSVGNTGQSTPQQHPGQ